MFVAARNTDALSTQSTNDRQQAASTARSQTRRRNEDVQVPNLVIYTSSSIRALDVGSAVCWTLEDHILVCTGSNARGYRCEGRRRCATQSG